MQRKRPGKSNERQQEGPRGSRRPGLQVLAQLSSNASTRNRGLVGGKEGADSGGIKLRGSCIKISQRVRAKLGPTQVVAWPAFPSSVSRGGTPKKPIHRLEGQIGAGGFTLVLFLYGSLAVELLRRRVFWQRLGRSITHQRHQAIGECAAPAEVVVSAGKLLEVHGVALGAQHIA